MHYAEGKDGRDWLLLHTLEPHSHGEDFVEGLITLMKRLEVSEYLMIGSMYAPVPHTRPPLVSGGASSETMRERLRLGGVRESGYEGPTTILARLGTSAPALAIETATMIVQLPAYAQLERDYRGLGHMLGLLNGFYGLSLDPAPLAEQVSEETRVIEQTVDENPQLKAWIGELERMYDADHDKSPEEGPPAAPLSPELESFLRDVEGRLGEN